MKKAIPYYESILRITRKHLEITKRLFMADFEVRTTEYFTFMKGIDFSESPETTDLSQRGIPPRRYDNGRMLGITICNRDAEPYPEADKISLTLALLFNEFFFTIFPETYQYILAATPFDARIPIETTEKEIRKLAPTCLFHPLKISETFNVPDKGAVCFFMIEDAATDMGLLKAVYDNWEYLFMILEDYLTWFLESQEHRLRDTEKKGKLHTLSGFLTYGLEAVPEFLCLEPTRELLTMLVGDRPMNIRKSRERFNQ
jgi:hypothetical protein